MRRQTSSVKYTPNWSFECQYTGHVCGVDEAGRGPLAGPVVAAAVIFPRQHAPDGLTDSKCLSHSQREHLLNIIRKTAIIGIGISEPEEIDRINILQASLTAMKRAIADLPLKADIALIDGNKCPNISIPCEAIIKGDARSFSIAAASIVAKVTRDRIMARAHQRYPAYDLDRHKGYPTKAHREKLIGHGPAPIHRLSFAPVKEMR
ncbi:MAG: ribonuclease HII [Maricaulaceae bacterium]